MAGWRRRAVSSALSVSAAAALLLCGLTAPGASAYSTPFEVPNPFQDYSARDYADAIWNLETSTSVRGYHREAGEDCDVLTYEVAHPLGAEPERTYVHIADEDDWWCSGGAADAQREEYDELEETEENFYHGRPYENVAQRVPYYGTWADVNGNGVTSRTEIHARDLGNSTFTLSGTYYDHYSGQQVNIGETETHGEHMIPVGHTWPEMQHRSREQRVAYYNDHMNLTSTIGSTNREKGGQTPSEWMPENEDAHCAYGMTWTHIANKHQISLFQRDVDHLRGLLWDCLEEELDGADTLTDQRSPDLQWQSLPPEPDPEGTAETSGGPREHYGTGDYADALWNLENHVRVRSAGREEHEDCDVQTYTTTGARGGSTQTYARVISPENTYCSGEEGDELRAELDKQAEEEDSFFHSSPLGGKRRDYFGYWRADDDGVNTRHRVIARDFETVEWNSTETGIVGGDFYDPYTGEYEHYHGPDTVIDHILPVEHAWVEMEHRDQDPRQDYHNDPTNLLAISAAAANQKAADAPRNWMPEHQGFHCRYAVAWTHTAVKHDVSLFDSDISQLRRTLYQCAAEGGDADGEGLRREELEWASLPPS